MVAGLAVSAAGSAAALAADRLYDAEVRRLIASANREVGVFGKHSGPRRRGEAGRLRRR